MSLCEGSWYHVTRNHLIEEGPKPVLFLLQLQIREACVHKTLLEGLELVWVR